MFPGHDAFILLFIFHLFASDLQKDFFPPLKAFRCKIKMGNFWWEPFNFLRFTRFFVQTLIFLLTFDYNGKKLLCASSNLFMSHKSYFAMRAIIKVYENTKSCRWLKLKRKLERRHLKYVFIFKENLSLQEIIINWSFEKISFVFR